MTSQGCVDQPGPRFQLALTSAGTQSCYLRMAAVITHPGTCEDSELVRPGAALPLRGLKALLFLCLHHCPANMSQVLSVPGQAGAMCTSQGTRGAVM